MNRLDIPNIYYGKWNFPIAKKIMEAQQDRTWTAQEIAVEDDVNDYRHNMTQEQRTLVETILQSFMEIEQHVGDIWFDIAKWWEQPDIEMACLEIGRMEKCVHAPFYQAMSDVLLIEPETIYNNKRKIKPIKEKLEFIGKIFNDNKDNKLVTLASLALTEQVLLFGNFAVLKSFKANGINLIPNTVSGVTMVTFDEGLHGELAKYLFGELIKESSKKEKLEAFDIIDTIGDGVMLHEFEMIDLLFNENETINGIDKYDLKDFIQERTVMVLSDLGIIEEVDEKELVESDVASWFYDDVNGIRSFDFFAATGNQYTREWSKTKFKWVQDDEKQCNPS